MGMVHCSKRKVLFCYSVLNWAMFLFFNKYLLPMLEPLDDSSVAYPHHHQLHPHLTPEETLLWVGNTQPPQLYNKRQLVAMPFLVAWSLGMAWLLWNYGLPQLFLEATGLIGTGIAAFYIGVLDAPIRYWWAKQWVYGLTSDNLIRKNGFWVQRYALSAIKQLVYHQEQTNGNVGFLYYNYDPITRKKDWVHIKWKHLVGGNTLYLLLQKQLNHLEPSTLPVTTNH